MEVTDNLKMFTGRANPDLAKKISEYMGIPLGAAKLTRFPDSELMVKIEEDVRGRDVFLIQPTCAPVHENLMELLVFIDCARRASAERITVVMPYFGYARQDRKDEGRVPISAKLVANMIATAGADRVLTIDLHAGQIQGFFDIPLDNMYAEPVLGVYFDQLKMENLVLVSPDIGSVKRARAYIQRLGGEGFAIIDKFRINASEAEVRQMIGDVKGKTVLMIDDVITTAGTVCAAAQLCKTEGAEKVYVAATHGVLCGPAAERIRNSPIDELVVTDTIPVSQEKADAIGKLKVLSVAELIGEAIHRIHNNQSVSSLFLNGQTPTAAQGVQGSGDK